MSGKHCRLYDENLVHNIMVSTGLSVMEFLRENRNANTDEVCEFIELNSRNIIDDTIDHLNSIDSASEKDPIEQNESENDEPWAVDEDEGR